MDRRKAWLRVGLWALVIAWMGLIFCFSMESDHQSDQTSGGVIRYLLTIFDRRFSGLSPSEQVLRMEDWSFVVRKLAHAVLAVEEGGEIYILDNISSAIVPHSRLTQYVPAYSLNEEKAWVHLKGRAK